MYRFLLTPRWLGINLFAVLAIPGCIWLGVWQLGRFEQRTHASDHRAAHSTAQTQAVALDMLLQGPDAHGVIANDVGREITFTGQYDAAHQLLVAQRTVNGRSGYYVLTPLRLDGDGPRVAVIRGWTASSYAPAAPPAGTVRLQGRLQTSEDASSPEVIGSGVLPAGQVGMISPSTLVNLLPYSVVDGWIALDASSGAAGSEGALVAVPTYQPSGGNGLTLQAFQNLGYTCQWFVFAGFVVFMWARFARREAELVRDHRLGLTTD